MAFYRGFTHLVNGIYETHHALHPARMGRWGGELPL
jgi:hypothetical protein